MTERPQAKSGARFHCDLPLASGAKITLPERVVHHALRVLRLQAGDALVLFNGEGGEFDATLARVAGREAMVEIGAWHDVERESPLAITLAQGISSADRMDYTLQKAVELGVGHIQPLQTTKSIVRLDEARLERRLAHWRQIVISACEQCGRNRIPEIAPSEPLRAWLGRAREGVSLLLSPRSTQRISDLEPSSRVCLLAGPEGGFTAEEEAAAAVAGFRAINLGPRILRTETAAIAAISALQTRWGDL